jgi:hypothetical protein
VAVQTDDSTVTQIAECVSRGEHLTIAVDAAIEVGLWCSECHDHVAVIYPVHGLSDTGVYDLGTVTACTVHDARGRTWSC